MKLMQDARTNHIAQNIAQTLYSPMFFTQIKYSGVHKALSLPY